MKKILFIILVCASYVSSAQNLESKIPNTAKAVVSINGDRLFELVSISEFDDYSFIKKLFEELNRKNDSTKAFASLEDFGFSTSSKAYYFYTDNDSVRYHTILLQLTDKNKFESLLPLNMKDKIERKDNNNIMTDNNSAAIWDDQILVLSFGDKTRQFFQENDGVEPVEEVEEAPIEESNYASRKSIMNNWLKKHVTSILNGSSGQSITTNKSYLASRDKNAVASSWIHNYGELMSGAMSGFSGMYGIASLTGTGLKSSLYGFKSVTANLYIEDDGMRMSTEMEVSDDWQKIFKKIFKSKMNANFFKYFNQNEVLAYMSFSMDMQGVFEEYPTMMANIYGEMEPKANEEIQVARELMSMLLDEKAIGELITGDMLFVLNDFGEKEVAYTSYEYDEDYNRKEVKKTKMDMMPDFTLMIGSEKGKFLTKTALLGVKYELAESKLGYFKVQAPRSEIPFDLYTAVKNDILFFTTSEDKISKIVNNSYVNNVGKHQKLIKNNISTVYVNGQQMLSKVPASALNKREAGYLKFVQQNFKDAYFKSSRMKGNKMQSEVKINTVGSQKNSIKLMLDFIDILAK